MSGIEDLESRLGLAPLGGDVEARVLRLESLLFPLIERLLADTESPNNSRSILTRDGREYLPLPDVKHCRDLVRPFMSDTGRLKLQSKEEFEAEESYWASQG